MNLDMQTGELDPEIANALLLLTIKALYCQEIETEIESRSIPRVSHVKRVTTLRRAVSRANIEELCWSWSMLHYMDSASSKVPFINP